MISPRAALRLGIACVVEFACARRDDPHRSVLAADVPPVAVMPDVAEVDVEEPSLVFSPVDVWRVGQRWRTFEPEESFVLTEFEVISIRDGVTTIRATNLAENSAEPPLEMRFDGDGQRIGEWPQPERHRVVAALQWPTFPLMEASAVGDPPEHAQRQVVRRDGSIFTVVLEQKYGGPKGLPYFHRILQWEVGRPWFDYNAWMWSSSPDSFPEGFPDGISQITVDWDLETAPGSP